MVSKNKEKTNFTMNQTVNDIRIFVHNSSRVDKTYLDDIKDSDFVPPLELSGFVTDIPFASLYKEVYQFDIDNDHLQWFKKLGSFRNECKCNAPRCNTTFAKNDDDNKSFRDLLLCHTHRSRLSNLFYKECKQRGCTSQEIKQVSAQLTLRDDMLIRQSKQYKLKSDYFCNIYAYLTLQKEIVHDLLSNLSQSINNEKNGQYYNFVFLVHMYLDKVCQLLILFYGCFNKSFISVFYPCICQAIGYSISNEIFATLDGSKDFKKQDSGINRDSIAVMMYKLVINGNTNDGKNYNLLRSKEIEIEAAMQGISIFLEAIYDIYSGDSSNNNNNNDGNNPLNYTSIVSSKLMEMVDNIKTEQLVAQLQGNNDTIGHDGRPFAHISGLIGPLIDGDFQYDPKNANNNIVDGTFNRRIWFRYDLGDQEWFWTPYDSEYCWMKINELKITGGDMADFKLSQDIRNTIVAVGKITPNSSLKCQIARKKLDLLEEAMKEKIEQLKTEIKNQERTENTEKKQNRDERKNRMNGISRNGVRWCCLAINSALWTVDVKLAPSLPYDRFVQFNESISKEFEFILDCFLHLLKESNANSRELREAMGVIRSLTVRLSTVVTNDLFVMDELVMQLLKLLKYYKESIIKNNNEKEDRNKFSKAKERLFHENIRHIIAALNDIAHESRFGSLSNRNNRETLDKLVKLCDEANIVDILWDLILSKAMCRRNEAKDTNIEEKEKEKEKSKEIVKSEPEFEYTGEYFSCIRIILSISKTGANNKKLHSWLIENYDENNYCKKMSKYYLQNTHPFECMMQEWRAGAKGEVVERGLNGFYPQAWKRAEIGYLFSQNEKLVVLLAKYGIFESICQSLSPSVGNTQEISETIRLILYSVKMLNIYANDYKWYSTQFLKINDENDNQLNSRLNLLSSKKSFCHHFEYMYPDSFNRFETRFDDQIVQIVKNSTQVFNKIRMFYKSCLFESQLSENILGDDLALLIATFVW